MNTKTPAIVFLVLGIIFIVFSKPILVGFKWVEKKIWNEEKRKQFPAYESRDYKPWMFMVLGVSWIACAIFFWFTSK